jgi:hypothetical protein
MSSVVVDGFLKNAAEMVVGEIADFKGKTYAHLRIVVASAEEEGEWVRTKKGVSIESDRFHLIREGVQRLYEVASLDRVVSKIPVGRDEIWIGVQPFHRDQYVYVRRFYRDDDGEWQPTQKGVSVRTDRLDDLVDLVDRVAKTIDEADA